ncbi:hypothetical protein K402DRAFT_258409 [Aulographum hederae CBS 113979]|uniref:Uncharacterized protein n=1 Tax=Aulographum hederae CBS 113979 TaxID=1176131 RepID=A0A6G1H962_9PEZI|nr:hypothetical protein K402DRAFT_258409 [Aulographum hederae CBS 113979]
MLSVGPLGSRHVSTGICLFSHGRLAETAAVVGKDRSEAVESTRKKNERKANGLLKLPLPFLRRMGSSVLSFWRAMRGEVRVHFFCFRALARRAEQRRQRQPKPQVSMLSSALVCFTCISYPFPCISPFPLSIDELISFFALNGCLLQLFELRLAGWVDMRV